MLSSIIECLEPADAGILYFYDKAQQQLVAKVAYGYSHGHIEHSLQSTEDIAGHCLTLHKSLLLTSLEDIVKATSAPKRASTKDYIKIREGLPPILGIIAIPVKFGDNILGVLIFEHYKEHRAFKEEDVTIIERLACCVALVLENMNLHLELKNTKRSYRDLLGRWITTTEEERKLIAREIHDQINQLLLSIKLTLESMESSLPTGYATIHNKLEISKSRINQVFN